MWYLVHVGYIRVQVAEHKDMYNIAEAKAVDRSSG